MNTSTTRRPRPIAWTALFAVLSVMTVWTAPQTALAQEPPAPPTSEPTETAPANAADDAQPAGDAADDAGKPAVPLSPRELIDTIGWYFLAPFILASFLAIWFGIERLVVLRRGRVIPRAFVERFLDHLEQGKLDPDTALQLCEENGSPVAQVFAHGVRKWGKPSVEVEQAIIDGGERQVSQLRKHLRMINGVSTVSPLIGLLGTVVGMILAFNRIASAGAMGKPEQLGTDIAMALLTTAIGLMIAIPAMILYLYLASRIDSLVMEMDLLAQDVVHLISYEALSKEGGPTRSKSRSRAAKKKAV